MSNALTVNQKTAAKMLGVSSVTLWKWRRDGLIQSLPNFNTPRYSVAQLKAIAGEKANDLNMEQAA